MGPNHTNLMGQLSHDYKHSPQAFIVLLLKSDPRTDLVTRARWRYLLVAEHLHLLSLWLVEESGQRKRGLSGTTLKPGDPWLS